MRAPNACDEMGWSDVCHTLSNVCSCKNTSFVDRVSVDADADFHIYMYTSPCHAYDANFELFKSLLHADKIVV